MTPTTTPTRVHVVPMRVGTPATTRLAVRIERGQAFTQELTYTYTEEN